VGGRGGGGLGERGLEGEVERGGGGWGGGVPGDPRCKKSLFHNLMYDFQRFDKPCQFRGEHHFFIIVHFAHNRDPLVFHYVVLR